jgi:xanthine dehydrogenase accessory factor
MHEFYDKLPELINEHSKLALTTVIHTIGSTPREIGAKMAVLPDGSIHGTIGGGRLELLVIQDALEAIKTGVSTTKEYSLHEEDQGGIGAICGGDSKVFIEVIDRGEQLIILGGGHIALALYEMAAEVDFLVVVVDERPEFANTKRFPKAHRVLNCPVDDLEVKKLVNKDSYIVVITHGHKNDKAAVKRLINCDYKYLGMIGSKKKVNTILAELETEGVTQEKLDSIYSPIGLDINAETPAEIAVSILAELVQVRKTGAPSGISLKLTGR